jgi:hypothetical protein
MARRSSTFNPDKTIIRYDWDGGEDDNGSADE